MDWLELVVHVANSESFRERELSKQSPRSPIRILHVIGSLAPRYGGPSKVLPEMCRALADRGHEVEVFTTDVDGAGRARVPIGTPVDADGFRVTYFRVHAPRSYAASLGLAHAVRQRVSDFDVVHVHSLYLFHTAVTCASCRRKGVPYVLRPHGTLDPYHRARHRARKFAYDWLIERRNLERADAVHYTSVAELAYARDAGLRTNGFVVPNGVDVSGFSDSDQRALFDLYSELEGKRLITFLGRLTAKKRLDLVLEAFASVAKRHEDVHLVIAGPNESDREQRLRAQARELGLEGRFTFTGLIQDQQKVALLRASSVFVLPSEAENFAVSVVEAMAAEVPVVVTKGVAIHEDVARANAGFVVCRTSSAVAGAIIELVEDVSLSRRFGENGGRLVRAKYAWPRVAQQLEMLYRSAID